jgi:hypothetical protein
MIMMFVNDFYSCIFRASKMSNYLMVAAIDFGTTYSGYAFSTISNFKLDPLKIHVNQAWNACIVIVSFQTDLNKNDHDVCFPVPIMHNLSLLHTQKILFPSVHQEGDKSAFSRTDVVFLSL